MQLHRLHRLKAGPAGKLNLEKKHEPQPPTAPLTFVLLSAGHREKYVIVANVF